MNQVRLRNMGGKEYNIKAALQERIQGLDPCDYIPAEMSLERIAFFTPSSPSQKKPAEKVIRHPELDVRLSVHPSTGLPITIDQDYYRAFQKIVKEHLDRGGNLTEAIAVSTNRLLKYSGKRKSDRRVQEVRRFFDRMADVAVKATYRPKKGAKPLTIRGSVFNTVLSPGEEFEDTGEAAETNYVWLSRWYVQNFADNYLRSIDLAFHNSLRKPYAKALYPILQTGWYASRRKGKYYEKRYSHLCDLFMLPQYQSKADIRKQLEPALIELQDRGFLIFDPEKHYRRAKSDHRDWVLTFWPGPKYLDDRQRMKDRQELAKRIKASLQEHNIVEPFGGPQVALLEDILDVCRDPHSEKGYRKVIMTYPESTIRAALSETKLAAHQGTIRKSRGAYFMDTLSRLNEYRTN